MCSFGGDVSCWGARVIFGYEIERYVFKLGKQNETLTKNDFITNKIMIVFVLAFAMSVALMLVNRGLDNVDTFVGTYYTVYIFGFAGVAGTLLGIVKEIVDRRQGRDLSHKLVTGHGIAVCSAIVAISAFLILFGGYSSSIRLLYIAIPALAVLYLFYMIYQREFSVLTTLGVLLSLYFWRFAQFYKGSVRFLAAQCILLVLCVLVSALLFFLKKDDGVLKLGKKKFRLLDADAEYGASFLYVALFAVILLAAFFVPNVAMIYLAFTTLAVVFIMAVYYAVRMM